MILIDTSMEVYSTKVKTIPLVILNLKYSMMKLVMMIKAHLFLLNIGLNTSMSVDEHSRTLYENQEHS